MRSVSIRVSLSIVLFLVTVLALPLRGQPQQAPSANGQSQATFKVRVEYVEVDAVVHDKQGNFVADLKKEDFDVLEDGKPQRVEHVELVDVPVERQPFVAAITRRTIEPDVVSNAQPTGRVYLIVLDDLHIFPTRTIGARKIAHEFLERTLAPNDVAAVVATSGSRTGGQEFTSNRRLLAQAIDRVVGRKLVSAGQAMIANDYSPLDPNATPAGTAPSRPQDPGARERLYNAQSSLTTLMGLATFAGNIHNRRKAMVLISEGPAYDLSGQTFHLMEEATANSGVGAAGEGSASRVLRDDFRAFVNAANRANLTLYAFDPRIYTQGGDDLVDIASGPPPANRDVGSKTEPEATIQGTMWDDIVLSRDNLQLMSAETGGFATTGSLAAADKAFTRIRDDNSHYYIVGYYPSNDKNDGKFRKIDVRCKRSGVTVTARKGYVAPKSEKAAPGAVVTKEGTSPALREAVLAPLPTSGLPMTVTASPFRGSKGTASVLLMMQIPAGTVKFVEKDGKYEGRLEVSFVAVNTQGKTAGGERLDLAMPLKRETYDAISRVGLLIESRVALEPGRYVLRIGARDGMSERVGAVHCDLEVPDFDKLPIAMSGLIVSSGATSLANPRPDAEMARMTRVLPGSPVVERVFGADDTLGVLTEVYDSKLATPHDIDITTAVLAEDGSQAYRHDEKRSTSELKGMTGGFGYALKVPLNAMSPGTYVLRVQATSRLDVDKPVARETVFRIVGK